MSERFMRVSSSLRPLGHRPASVFSLMETRGINRQEKLRSGLLSEAVPVAHKRCWAAPAQLATAARLCLLPGRTKEPGL